MNCPYCNYLLFNLSRPVCPECGRAFDVCDFRFDPGAVHFACLECGQEYAGNSERGLPYPREFTCTHCDSAVDASSMRVVPQRSDAVGEFAVPTSSPWERRRWIGTWPAWWQTVKMTMTQPTRFFKAHRDQSFGEAYRFAVMTTYLGPGLGMALLGFLAAAIPTMLPSVGNVFGLGAVFMWAAAVVVPLLMPLVVGTIFGGSIHLAMVILAPQRRSLGHTYRMVQYAMGPLILCAMPVLANDVGYVWFLVTAILGVCAVHRVGGWRGAIAVLWLPLAVLGIVLGAVFVLA